MRSPVTHAAASALPVMIAIAEFENPLLDLYGLELAHSIAISRRRGPRFLRLAGHNHISMVAHFKLAGTELATATCGSIRLKLLKIGALVTRSVRRVRIAMASSSPDAAVFRRAHARLCG